MPGSDDLSREELLELVRGFAKHWLAHDGLRFWALEYLCGWEFRLEEGGG